MHIFFIVCNYIDIFHYRQSLWPTVYFKSLVGVKIKIYMLATWSCKTAIKNNIIHIYCSAYYIYWMIHDFSVLIMINSKKKILIYSLFYFGFSYCYYFLKQYILCFMSLNCEMIVRMHDEIFRYHDYAFIAGLCTRIIYLGYGFRVLVVFGCSKHQNEKF